MAPDLYGASRAFARQLYRVDRWSPGATPGRSIPLEAKRTLVISSVIDTFVVFAVLLFLTLVALWTIDP